MRTARQPYALNMLLAAAVCCGVVAGALALTAPARAAGSADPIADPVDQQQLSEPLRDMLYQKQHPLIQKKDRATVRTREQPPPEGSETPASFNLTDQKSGPQCLEAQGGQCPSKGHPMSDAGQILPDGRYAWCGPDIGCLTGCTPNPSYGQAPADPPANVQNLGNGPMMDKLREVMNGLPMTNSQFAVLSAMGPQAGVDQALDPKGWTAAMKQAQQTQTSEGANQQAQCAERNCSAAFSMMRDTLINVANEGSGTPTLGNVPFKTYSQAVWMVQQMYKQCFVPMAILLVLPGAILTQLKGLVAFSMLDTHDDDTLSPITGIIRAMMAIFLIPATQLIVSYVIDVGNSLTDSVKTYVQVEQIQNWACEQTFGTSPQNADNCIKNICDTGTPMPFRGKLADASEKSTVFERQSYTTTALQNIFNTINAAISEGLAILNGFQIVLMCYLFLMGPIAAAFFAWPSGIGRDTFRKCFNNWMDGVVVLALWKFWWCIVLLCMSVRLQTSAINPNDQFELYIYTAFMGLLLFVPFQPFDFKPGEIVSTILEKASKSGGAGGSGGGSGSGSGGGSGSGSGGGCGGGGSTGGGDGGTGSCDSTASTSSPSVGSRLEGFAGKDGSASSTSAAQSDTAASASSSSTVEAASGPVRGAVAMDTSAPPPSAVASRPAVSSSPAASSSPASTPPSVALASTDSAQSTAQMPPAAGNGGDIEPPPSSQGGRRLAA